MNREIDAGVVTTRVLPYTPEEVFAAWTDPKIVAQWWGPVGFGDEIETFDLSVGGHWKHVLRGPDGKGYDNLAVFTAIEAPHVLGFAHYLGFEQQGTPHYTNLTHFAAHPDGMLLSMQMVFESQAYFDGIKHIILPANEQNFDKLEAVLGKVYGVRRE
ncbi:SRPBCC domain-containing protein [Devosia sp.]|uniref:SRPBCC domain-containing protein n=1 Tax=Devosia sp. TaxID=1871048 RepID=UPI003266B5EC